MFRLALRELVGRPRRFLTTAAAVLLGVAFMTGSLVYTDTIRATFDGLISDTSRGTDAYVRSSSVVEGMFEEQRGSLPDTIVADVAAVDGVRVALPNLENRSAQIVGRDNEMVGDPNTGAPTLLLVWPTDATLNPADLTSGSRAPAADGEVVIDADAARKAGVGVGDDIRIITRSGSSTFSVVGIVTFDGKGSLLGATTSFFTLSEAQQLAEMEGRVDSVAAASDGTTTQAELRNRIGAALVGQSAEVLTGEEYVREQQAMIGDFLDAFNRFLLIFAGVALFVGAFLIYNTFTILVTQRTRELALLRAVGAARGQVFASVAYEAILVGLGASLLGVGAGAGLASGLKALVKASGFDIPADGLVFAPRTVVAALTCGLTITVVSAGLPAWRAARVPPLAAMRQVAVDRSGRSLARLVAGVLITGAGAGAVLLGLFGDISQDGAVVGLGAAASFLGLVVIGPVLAPPVARLVGWPFRRRGGLVGELATQNAVRNPKRTAATADALMLGVGIVALISVFAASAKGTWATTIRSSFHSDLIVDSGTFGGPMGGFSPTLTKSLNEVPEVEAAASFRVGLAEVMGDADALGAGRTQPLLGIDPAPFDTIFDLDVVAGSLDDLDGAVLVYEGTMKWYQWEVGDTIRMRFAETGVQELRIGAVYANQIRPDFDINYYLPLPVFDEHIPARTDAQIFVNLRDGVGLEKGRGAIDAAVVDYPNAKVQTLDEYTNGVLAQIDQFLGLIYGLLFFSIVIALLGIVNTLMLSLYERTREIGLLRAVGMSRRQLRQMVRGEAVIVALLGTSLGLGIGLFLGIALVKSLDDQDITLHLPISQLLTVAVLAAIAGVLSSLGPARRAARMDILDAIASE